MAIVVGNLDVSNKSVHKFADLQLDLTTAVSRSKSTDLLRNDVAVLYDMAALKTRISNLLSTVPGEMVLDPTYGCNLNQYLFDPVSRERGYVIGRYVRAQIEKHVPQIKLNNIIVAANSDLQQYDLEIVFSCAWLNQQGNAKLVISKGTGNISIL